MYSIAPSGDEFMLSLVLPLTLNVTICTCNSVIALLPVLMQNPGTRAWIKQALAALNSFIEKLMAVQKCCKYVSSTDFG